MGHFFLLASKNVKLTTTDVEVEPSPEGIYQTANKLQPCNDKVRLYSNNIMYISYFNELTDFVHIDLSKRSH